MKKIIQAINKWALLTLFVFMQIALLAQSNSVTVTESEAKNFFSQPWVWAVGGVLLILIIVALFSGNKDKHKQIIKTTVIKEEKTI